MKYKREPQHDKRIEHGDEFSGNAWRDTETNEIRYVAVYRDELVLLVRDLCSAEQYYELAECIDSVSDEELINIILTQGSVA
ncbi:MAG: hypothetical protein ABW104_18040 [Candidatus Thiodiazotropha sp. 6PLUC2]|nr:hypothetical protein [Candidatus Thiodiazotropha lotti]MCW4218804.1 hypothetical protein [Candidatus Thiodiazotropha lotti]